MNRPRMPFLPTLAAAMLMASCRGDPASPASMIVPNPAIVPIPSGIYVLNEASDEQSTATAYATGLDTATAYRNDVVGHAVFVPIAKILPSVSTWGQFSWSWGYLDTLVGIATAQGKKFSVELETGFQGSSTYLQSLPAGFATACGSDCAPLFDVWTGNGRCITSFVLLPWVDRVREFWSAAGTALAAHLRQTGAYGSLTLVHVPGLSIYDEEIRLPTGFPRPAPGDTLHCPDGRLADSAVVADADTARWRALGYSDSGAVSGFAAIAQAYAHAFPDRFLGLSLFNPGTVGIDFPNLNGHAVGAVAAQIVQTVSRLVPGRLQVQADNLDTDPVVSEVLTLSAQNGDSVGWQSNKRAGTGAGCNGGGAGSCGPDGPDSPYFQLLLNGSTNRGEYVEVWSADVLAYPQSLAAAKSAGLYSGR